LQNCRPDPFSIFPARRQEAWQGLIGAVHQDGKLGNVQAIGAAPAKLTAEDNQEYGSGAFLLAGSEMYKLK